MKDSVAFSLRFENNDTNHDDLVLQFKGKPWVCDSYYFVIDRNLLPDKEDAQKVRAVLRRLLEQWLSAIELLLDDGVVYLPFDFSDQYTGWLMCKRSGDNVTVSPGWAIVEGWSFYPSLVGDLSVRPSGFRVNGRFVRCSLTELVDTIRASLTDASEPVVTT